MQKIAILSFVLISFLAKAQEEEKPSVAKNLFGVQLGLVNSSFYYETKLHRKIALRAETGLELGYAKNGISETTFITPYLALEPRWYFGLDRRKRLEKNYNNNGSNYFSLRTAYFSNKTPLLNTGDFKYVSALWLIPKLGIRRNFSKHFNYEFSGGVGYQYNFFSKQEGCNCEHLESVIDLQIRIGYDF